VKHESSWGSPGAERYLKTKWCNNFVKGGFPPAHAKRLVNVL
jgi:hypothetical protein